LKLSEATSRYERDIARRWEQAKREAEDDDRGAIAAFIAWFVTQARRRWERALLNMLGIEEFTPEQLEVFEAALAEHIRYIQDSLEPAIVAQMELDDDRSLAEKLLALDHRVTAMYAGALWAAGSLMFAMFDGAQPRDMVALFMFAGPNDANTCTGPRGCDQYANHIFPLAQILAEDIIPGHLECLTNCRHMLLPIVRIPAGEERQDIAAMMEEEGIP